MILALQQSVTGHINPFGKTSNPMLKSCIVNVASGMYASKSVSEELLKTREKGEELLEAFVTERLSDKTKSVFEPLKRVGTKTLFDNTGLTSKVNNALSSLKSSNRLLFRLMEIQQIEQVDMEEVLQHSLQDVPYAFGNSDGSMTATNKSELVIVVKGRVPEIEVPHSEVPPLVVINDAMPILRQFRRHQLPKTFGGFCNLVFEIVMKKAARFNASTIHLVWDTYPEVSIKSAEQARRMASKGASAFHINNAAQNLPRGTFQEFLSLGENKESLIEFIFEHWSDQAQLNGKLEGKLLYFAHKKMCHLFQLSNGILSVVLVPALECDHQEADTRLLLHAYFTWSAIDFSGSIVIFSADTDVFFLLMSNIYKVKDQCVLFLQGSCDNVSNMNLLKNAFSKEKCEAILGLHSFSGCDSVSSFRGKGKKSVFKVFESDPQHIVTFARLGKSFLPDPVLLNELEKFTCKLYGFNDENCVNRARYNIYKKKKTIHDLPPTKDNLIQHAHRATYQAAIWRKAHKSKIGAPAAKKHGWISCEGKLDVKWSSLPILPPAIRDRIQCKCRTGCSKKHCNCLKNDLKCTSLCGCMNCTNKSQEDETESDESSDDEVTYSFSASESDSDNE